MNIFLKNIKWQPPAHWSSIKTIDMHTGGEPLRIPVSGLPQIPGNTVLEKRRYFKKHLDHIRTGLMYEPKGHADMYGAIVSAPTTPEADFDVFFIHNEGYSTMCGHAIIALTKFAMECGLIDAKRKKHLTINVPAGQIYAEAQLSNGSVVQSSFINVPSYLYLQDRVIEVKGIGKVPFDIAFGGAFYVIVEAGSIGLSLAADNYNQLIDYGRKIKNAVIQSFEIAHPAEEDLSFLYGTIFTGPADNKDHHSRNVCIFAEGEVDRSATGSGVSARAGLHYSKGDITLNEPIIIESILGSTMTVEVVEVVDFHGFEAVIPKVTGKASYVGQHTFYFDPEDPFREGFIFR